MDLELKSSLIFPAHQAEFQAASWHQSFWIYFHKALLCLILSKSLFLIDISHQLHFQLQIHGIKKNNRVKLLHFFEGVLHNMEQCWSTEMATDMRCVAMSQAETFHQAVASREQHCLPWSPGDISRAGGELWVCCGCSQSLAATRWEQECFLKLSCIHITHPPVLSFHPQPACTDTTLFQTGASPFTRSSDSQEQLKHKETAASSAYCSCTRLVQQLQDASLQGLLLPQVAASLPSFSQTLPWCLHLISSHHLAVYQLSSRTLTEQFLCHYRWPGWQETTRHQWQQHAHQNYFR